MSSDDLKDPRDKVFWRIGRAVVNFQILEYNLKLLIPNLSVSGAPHELQALREKRIRELQNQTLGLLVHAFHDTIYGPPLHEREQPELAGGRITVGMELTSSTTQEEIESLLTLLRERNQLIHHDLAPFDFNSAEACERLCAQLDEQHERLSRHFATLESLQELQTAALTAFRQLFESAEFRAEFLGTPKPKNPDEPTHEV